MTMRICPCLICIFCVCFHYTICFTERMVDNHKNTKEDWKKLRCLITWDNMSCPLLSNMWLTLSAAGMDIWRCFRMLSYFVFVNKEKVWSLMFFPLKLFESSFILILFLPYPPCLKKMSFFVDIMERAETR